MLEECGGKVELAALPVGDPTLSAMELMCNESQERMGLLVAEKDLPLLKEICLRERAPCYVVGEITGDNRIVFEAANGERPMDLPLEVLFGSSPTTRLEDEFQAVETAKLEYSIETGDQLLEALKDVLSLEGWPVKTGLQTK